MRVLFATDLSRAAEEASRLIAGLAWPAGTEIRLLGVIEPVSPVIALVPEMMSTVYDPKTQREFSAAIASLTETLRSKGRIVDCVTALGRAADAIVNEASIFHADLVVLGSRGRGAVRSALLGSVSAEVADRAPCPVLIARRDRVTRIVFGEDGGARTLEAAAVLAWPVFRGCPIRVVTTVEIAPPYDAATEDRTGFERAVRAYLDASQQAHLRAEATAAESAARLTSVGVTATAEVREGAAAGGILGAADAFGADLIVVGSRGDRGFTRLLVGSVARDVLYHAGCSVLIARQATAERATKKREAELAASTRGA